MNRIVIIGNGFDKAHNLPTSYSDFMIHLKDSIAIFERQQNGTHKIKNQGKECGRRRGFYHRINEEGAEDEWIGVQQIKNELKFKLDVNTHATNKSIYFKSLIEENDKLGYWSDLEAHYFEILYQHRDNDQAIIQINREFEHLKKLLFNYLNKSVESEVDDGKNYDAHITHPIYEMLKSKRGELKFERTFFITFNYTYKLLNQYIYWLRIFNETEFPMEQIYIHGDLASPDNPIIFGYGDENSEKYNELEFLGNNELLRNFKTFQYLRSKKYNQILGLLQESNETYIQIIGHSCGLSDKALLRTIFQHPNVKLIESCYYKNETKYFENLYNISRIFDDNTLMREKLIPLESTFKVD